MWNIHRSKLPIVRNIKDLMIEAQVTHRYRTYDGPGKAFPNLRARKALEESGMWQPNNLAAIIKETLGVDLKKGDKASDDRIYHEDVWTPGKVPEFFIDGQGQVKQKMTSYGVAPRLHKGVNWLGRWSDNMVEYMLEDIDYLIPAHEELEKRILEEGQERVAWIENNTVFATAWMKYNGITPDVNRWYEHLGEQKEQAHHLLVQHLAKMFPEVNSFKSPVQVKAAMSRYIGAPVSSVDKAHIGPLALLYPGAKMFEDWKRLATRIQNWGPKFLKQYVCKVCSRFHPDWRQIGAETMRYSCSAPNLQQIPRDKAYRSLFTAKPGHWLSSLDYSAIEVVTAAVFARCDALLEACRTGNPHGAAAARTMSISFEEWEQLPEATQKNTRQSAKIVNFGLLFGGGALGLMNQAETLFRVKLTEQQAKDMIATYYALYPELKYSRNWAYRAMEGPQSQAVEVRNMVGMRRWLEGHNRKPTSWLNTIIQSSAGHGIKSSMRYVMEAGLLPYLCMQVHDELIFEFPGDTIEGVQQEYTRVAAKALLRGMEEVLGKGAPIVVDWKDTTGRTWL